MKKSPTSRKKSIEYTPEFRPYRVLFLVVVISVTCIVLFAALGVSSNW